MQDKEILICEVCGKECKGITGLKAHMRIHKDAELIDVEKVKEQPVEEVEEIVEEIIEEVIEEEDDVVVHTVMITYTEGTRWVAEFVATGDKEIKTAEEHAKKMGYTITLRDLVKVHI